MRISISSYSVHRNIGNGSISMLDFIRISRERYGIGTVELNSPFFEDRDGYLDEVKQALAKYNIQVQNIAIDMGNIADPDDVRRRESTQGNAAWLEVAKEIGCPSIRVNAGHSDDQEAGLKRSMSSFKEIVGKAGEMGLSVLMENHGGFSSDPDKIMEYVNELGTENFGTCPDFGNFPEEIRYEAIEKIAPFAKFVHAKTYEFDSEGNETTLDIPRIIGILRDSGYNGFISVEFEGGGDEYEGIQSSIDLLKRCGVEI